MFLVRSKLLPLNTVFQHNLCQHLFFTLRPLVPLGSAARTALEAKLRKRLFKRHARIHAAFAARDMRHEIYMYVGRCFVHVQMTPEHAERWVACLKSVRIFNQALFSRFCQFRMDACIVLISNL